MSEDNQDPSAQGQQTQAETAGGNENEPQAQQQFAGIEKRIGELTAKYRQAEEVVAQKDAQIAELVRNMTEMAMRSQQGVVPQEPQVEIDPEEQRRIQAILSPQMRRMEAMLAGLEQQVAMREVQSVAARYGDPRIEKRATELMQNWKRGGYTGWQPQDAVRYAAGELYEADRLKAQQGQAEQQRFNQLSNNVLTNQPPAPTSQPGNGALPANFDLLPPEKQLEILESRLNGKTF